MSDLISQNLNMIFKTPKGETVHALKDLNFNREIKETEKVYELKPKKLVRYGFGRLDALLLEKQTFQKTSKENKKTVILAPSYGENNLLEICGIELLEILLNSNFRVLLRPHFKILKESKELINTLKEKFSNNPNFILEKSVIPSEQFHNSICLISDWSKFSSLFSRTSVTFAFKEFNFDAKSFFCD